MIRRPRGRRRRRGGSLQRRGRPLDRPRGGNEVRAVPMTGWLVHLLTFALAAALAAWFTPRVRQAAVRFGIVDRPDGRLKTQAEPVAYLGGLAIFISFLIAIAFTVPFDREVLGLLLAGSIAVLV